ncbi:uncharacterized protein LOC128226830 isoform X1 [Mya arenaria]|uniref:uncharacterized protein LOC128226830 isoform X1 n=1 Tax=Mya arenaria TaxID=6604 RepID=UPI0022DFFB75|nr:uncharacterized protein LOC128226830 isoform X1 [Mya arenaria]
MPSVLMDSSRTLVLFLMVSLCRGDLCTDSKTKFQSTFPAMKEFSEDGIGVECFSDLKQCTEKSLEARYGTTMKVNDLDAPKPHNFAITPFCNGDKPGINVTWRLPNNAGAKSMKAFIVRIEVPRHEYRCVVVSLKGEVNLSNANSEFLGSFMDLNYNQNFHVSIRSLPSQNGTHSLALVTRTTDCGLSDGTDRWCPPLESFHTEYDYANRTLFLSFQQAEFGNLDFEIFETKVTDYAVFKTLVNTTSVVFHGFEPGNYSFTITGRDPLEHDSSRCLCKNKYGGCSACQMCKDYIAIAAANSRGNDTASASAETSLTAASSGVGNKKDNMSAVLAVVCTCTVVALVAIVAVTWLCHRRRRTVSSHVEGGKNECAGSTHVCDRYIIMIIEKTKSPLTEEVKEHILKHCNPDMKVIHTIGVNELKITIRNLSCNVDRTVYTARVKDTVNLGVKDVEVFGLVFAKEDLSIFYADVLRHFQDATFKNNWLKYKTAAVFRDSCDGLPKDACYRLDKDNSLLLKDIYDYFNKTPDLQSFEETHFVDLTSETPSAPNAKCHKESLVSNASSNVFSDNSTYVHTQKCRPRCTSQDSANGRSVSCSEVSFSPYVKEHIFYTGEDEKHCCLTVPLKDVHCYTNSVLDKLEFIEPDEDGLSDSETDDDPDGWSETDNLIAREDTTETGNSTSNGDWKHFVKKINSIQNRMAELNKRNLFI